MFSRAPNHNHDLQRIREETSFLTPPPSAPATSAAGSIAAAMPTAAAVAEDGLIIIGKGTRVDGKIGACSKLDVHGILEADVETHTLIIRKGGGVRGEINADRAEIHGIVEGKLTVRQHLEVQPTGQVSGEVSYSSIAIHTGGRMLGSINHSEEVAETPATDEPSTEAEVIHFNGGQSYR